MIKKIIKIEHDLSYDDEVLLNWFDMQKPNLSFVTEKNISVVSKLPINHLHENDILICDDGYAIKVKKQQDEMYVFCFEDSLTFAKYAYEIGNRHQPIYIENLKITVLNDVSLNELISEICKAENVKSEKILGYFKSNAKAHHTH